MIFFRKKRAKVVLIAKALIWAAVCSAAPAAPSGGLPQTGAAALVDEIHGGEPQADVDARYMHLQSLIGNIAKSPLCQENAVIKNDCGQPCALAVTVDQKGETILMMTSAGPADSVLKRNCSAKVEIVLPPAIPLGTGVDVSDGMMEVFPRFNGLLRNVGKKSTTLDWVYYSKVNAADGSVIYSVLLAQDMARADYEKKILGRAVGIDTQNVSPSIQCSYVVPAPAKANPKRFFFW